MATVRILLAFICLAAFSERNVPRRDLLAPPALPLLRIAGTELGVREASGKNDGPRVSAYLAAAGLKSGDPWCAAFISWVFMQAGYPLPRTGWSPALFPASRIRKAAAPGMIFGVYFPELKRIAHCGFVESLRGDWVVTIEGNTNTAGARDGDGVYRKWRPLKGIYRFADWRDRNE
jgi:hypothetical protein